MKIEFQPAGLKKTKWYQFLLRVLFGGVVTVITGVIAKKFGPVVGGLFLAFPAIFPASVTLVEIHEKQEKEQKGEPGARSGRKAAGAEAAGTVCGSFGLLTFAAVVWSLTPEHSPWFALALAALSWMAVAAGLWVLRQLLRTRSRRSQPAGVRNQVSH